MDYTISQLQKMLEERTQRLTELSSLRQSKLVELQEIDLEIEVLSGEPAGNTLSHVQLPKRKPGAKKKKPSTKKTSLDYAKDILKRHPGGLELEKLAEKIIDEGYATKSANFKNTLYQGLYKSEDITRNNDGKYVLS